MIDTVIWLSAWKDPGVEAVDAVDGDLVHSVQTYGAGKGAKGSLPCSLPKQDALSSVPGPNVGCLAGCRSQLSCAAVDNHQICSLAILVCRNLVHPMCCAMLLQVLLTPAGPHPLVKSSAMQSNTQ